ncbi:hypothetical protein C0J52_07708 [Blattella germanica]|nr:hypothetical protein C0J52_07708 [Blattella germanica]
MTIVFCFTIFRFSICPTDALANLGKTTSIKVSDLGTTFKIVITPEKISSSVSSKDLPTEFYF